MARPNVDKVLVTLLSIIGALGLLLLAGAWLMHVTTGQMIAGSGGIAAIAGGISEKLFSLLVLTAVVVVVAIVLLLRGRD